MCAGWRHVAFEVEQTMEDFELSSVFVLRAIFVSKELHIMYYIYW